MCVMPTTQSAPLGRRSRRRKTGSGGPQRGRNTLLGSCLAFLCFLRRHRCRPFKLGRARVNIPSPRRNVGRAGRLVKKDPLGQAVCVVSLVANHVLLLLGQFFGRGYHLTFACLSIRLPYVATEFMLSESKHGQDQCLPSHQRSQCGPHGHQPMLGGGLFFIVPAIAIKALLLVQGEQFDCLDLVGAQ